MTAQFIQPDYPSQPPEIYKGNIDQSMAANNQLSGQFAAHEAATPDMTVVLEPGLLMSGSILVSKVQQTTTLITAPGLGTNPRIDRIIIDDKSGAYSIISGTPSANPVPPAIPPGKLPNAQIQLTDATTTITNSLIKDERVTHVNKTNKSTLLSPASSISIGSLNVPAGRTIEAEAHLIGVSGTATLNLELNTDSTSVNYYRQATIDGVPGTASNNADTGIGINVSDVIFVKMTLSPNITSGETIVSIFTSRWSNAGGIMQNIISAIRYIITDVITSIGLSVNGGSAYIGAGSTINFKLK